MSTMSQHMNHEANFRRPLMVRILERKRLADDRGMATAEYALVTLAAAAFAGILIVIIRSDAVRKALSGVITSVFD